MDTREFLELLYQGAEGYTYLWTLPDKHTSSFALEQLDAMAQAAHEGNVSHHRNMFFSVGISTGEYPPNKRAKNEDIIAIPALWVDIDIEGAGHAAKNLPPTYAAARALLPGAIDPTVIVMSGHGIHAYYVFKEAMATETEAERAEAVDLLRRLQHVVRANALAHGWTVDSTTDLARVLRLPGTMNYKGSPVACEVAEYDAARLYHPEDFDVLPPAEETAPPAVRKTRFERCPTDGAATLMLANCAFLQYFVQHYRELPEPTWKAACTNLMRGVGGEDIILPLVKDWLGEKYNETETTKKLSHYLSDCQPQTCAHIRTSLGYACPEGMCDGIKAPCAWSVGKLGRARATVRAITLPDAQTLQDAEVVGALAVLQQANDAEYRSFYERCRGKVNLNEVKHKVKEARREAAGLNVIDGEGKGGPAPLKETRDTVPDSPLNLLVPANFAYGEAGVQEIKVTEAGYSYRLAAGHPVLPVCEVYNLDTQEEKITLAFKRFGRWLKKDLRRSEIMVARTAAARLADCGINISSESARHFVRYMQEMEKANQGRIPLAHAVSLLGWRPGSLDDFVLPSESAYNLDLDDEGEIGAAFCTAGTMDGWLRVASEVRKYPFARFLLAASFAAPTLKIFQNRNFLIYLWGTSGGGKTAAQTFALSVWGSPRRLMRSFLSTMNGIERAAEYSNDFPLGINEMQAANARDRQAFVEQLVYMIESGRGKGRASKTGIRRTASWRTIAIASGEEPLSDDSSMQGVKTRLIEINASPVLPNAFAHSLYASAEAHCGHAGKAFIARLTRLGEQGRASLTAARHALVQRLSEEYPEHFAPHIDNIATVALADMFASEWLFAENVEQAQREAYALAVQIMADMPTRADISDTERAWEFLMGWYQSNREHFEAEGKTTLPLSPIYGFRDYEYINIYPEPLRQAMKQAGFSPNKALKEFADHGKIASSMEAGKRRYAIRKHYGDVKVRVIRVPIGDST